MPLAPILDKGTVKVDASLRIGDADSAAGMGFVDSRAGDTFSGPSPLLAALQSVESQRPPMPRPLKLNRGRLSWSVSLESVDVGGVADAIVAEQVDTAIVAFVRAMHTHIRPMITDALTPKSLPNPIDAAFVRKQLAPLASYLDAQLSLLHAAMYPGVMEKMLTRLWSGVCVEMYDLLLPNLPVDNEVTNVTTKARRKSRRFVLCVRRAARAVSGLLTVSSRVWFPLPPPTAPLPQQQVQLGHSVLEEGPVQVADGTASGPAAPRVQPAEGVLLRRRPRRA